MDAGRVELTSGQAGSSTSSAPVENYFQAVLNSVNWFSNRVAFLTDHFKIPGNLPYIVRLNNLLTSIVSMINSGSGLELISNNYASLIETPFKDYIATELFHNFSFIMLDALLIKIGTYELFTPAVITAEVIAVKNSLNTQNNSCSTHVSATTLEPTGPAPIHKQSMVVSNETSVNITAHSDNNVVNTDVNTVNNAYLNCDNFVNTVDNSSSCVDFSENAGFLDSHFMDADCGSSADAISEVSDISSDLGPPSQKGVFELFSSPPKNDEEFLVPRKFARASTTPAVTSVPLQNSFQPLAAEQTDAVPTAVVNVEVREGEGGSNTSPRPKSSRPEPLHLKMEPGWRAHFDRICQLVNRVLPKKVVGEFIQILPADIDQFRKIQNYFRDNHVKGFISNLRRERPRKVLFRGIPPDVPSGEIQTHLVELGFPVSRVVQLQRWERETRTRRPISSFLCCLTPQPGWEAIYKIENVLGCEVKVSSFKNSGPRQCYNCQKFNHSSDNCLMDPVCLKCAGPHKTSDCKKSKHTPAKCANCKGDHPANFQLCPANPTQIKIRRELLKPKSVPRIPVVTEVAPQVPLPLKGTFSNAARRGGRQARPAPPSASPPTTAPVSGNSLFPPDEAIASNSVLNTPYMENTIQYLERINFLLENIQKLCNSLGIKNISDFIKTAKSNFSNHSTIENGSFLANTDTMETSVSVGNNINTPPHQGDVFTTAQP